MGLEALLTRMENRAAVTSVTADESPDVTPKPAPIRACTAVTPVTAENGVTASKATASITTEQETAIRAWLAHTEETDPEIIAEVLNQCRTDPDARDYFIPEAGEVPRPAGVDDDRRHCAECANRTLGGLCLAARRGEIAARRIYKPLDNIPRRCEGYAPKAGDPDQRPGRERWPELSMK